MVSIPPTQGCGVVYGDTPLTITSGWHIPMFGGKMGGIISFDSDRNKGILLLKSPAPSLGHDGRAFCPQLMDQYVEHLRVEAHIQMDESEWGSRLFFDFKDGFNFSAVYLSSLFQKVGIEYWENNTHHYFESPYSIQEGILYPVTYEVDGNIVTLIMDYNTVMRFQIPSRRVGSLGIETYRGKTHIRDFKVWINQPPFMHLGCRVVPGVFFSRMGEK
ncbi:MAG: hypothetical protein Q8P05_03900 [Candidatus Diapherotrites archaeon]|nr:hypothetical protein [Candidatus Diapherotrites archaeon]